MCRKHLIYHVVGYKFELHTLMGKAKNTYVTDIVTFPKTTDFITKKKLGIQPLEGPYLRVINIKIWKHFH